MDSSKVKYVTRPAGDQTDRVHSPPPAPPSPPPAPAPPLPRLTVLLQYLPAVQYRRYSMYQGVFSHDEAGPGESNSLLLAPPTVLLLFPAA